MGSQGYKLNESECVLKCDSSWCVSQAATAALPWPGKQDSKAYTQVQCRHKATYTLMHTNTHTFKKKYLQNRYACFHICRHTNMNQMHKTCCF